MNKLTFDSYFPSGQRGRPPTTQINILRYLSRFGKSKRTHVAKYFGKKNQEVKDSVNALVENDLLSYYCDLCKIEIKNYGVWKSHKNNQNHKDNLKLERKNENVEKTKPVIIVTKKGFEISIKDPLDEPDYDYVNDDTRDETQWGVITTTQFWNILEEVFYNSDDFEKLEHLCNLYENIVLEIYRENVSPYYFRSCLKEFKEYNNDVLIFGDEIRKRIFYEDLILKITAQNKQDNISKLNIIKQIKQNFNFNESDFDKYFEKLLSKGILEKISTKNRETYQITQLGLIILFHFLQTDTIFFSKNTPEYQKIIDSIKSAKKDSEKLFLKKFEKIRKKYAYLLPKILQDDNFRRLNLKPTGFLKIFDELYFSANDLEDPLGDHNFKNFMKFYEIREIDFGKKLQNYIESFSLTKTPMDEFLEKMPKKPKKISKNKIKYLTKLLDSETNYREKLVYTKNESYRNWLFYNPDFNNFDYPVATTNKKNFLRQRLSVIIYGEITTSIENKITFDFYSLYGKYSKDFEVKFKNSEIEKWYSFQLDKLSKYVSQYFEKIML